MLVWSGAGRVCVGRGFFCGGMWFCRGWWRFIFGYYLRFAFSILIVDLVCYLKRLGMFVVLGRGPRWGGARGFGLGGARAGSRRVFFI